MFADGPYLESQYYDAFKRVRNRLRKFDPVHIVLTAISRLHSQESRDIETIRHQPPWFLLLLIKWTIVHGDFVPSIKRELTDLEFKRLLNLIHDVDRSLRGPSHYDDLLLFLRGMAYQQFWHQKEPSRSAMSRQALLFRGLDPAHRFRKWFREETGIELDDWIDLSFMLLAGLLSKDAHFVTDGFFDPVQDRYPASVTRAFLESVSKTPAEIREYLSSLEEEKRRGSTEFRERTPLVRYPLINLAGRHYYYSIPVLLYSLENFVYDTLRRHDPVGFMVSFGPSFERYVRKGLEYLGTSFLTEDEIQGRTGAGKIIDFLLAGDGTNILIDAKGVEMNHGGMTSHRPEVVTGQAKSSIIKGITQAIETADGLAHGNDQNWVRENNFLLIVTFKDLYLGTGADFYRYVVQERLQKALKGDPEQSIVPLEHMYFVSVDEFDYLIQSLKASGISMGTVLRYAVEGDREPQTKRLQLSQHLVERFGPLSPPDYIQKEFQSLIGRAAQALGVKDLDA